MKKTNCLRFFTANGRTAVSGGPFQSLFHRSGLLFNRIILFLSITLVYLLSGCNTSNKKETSPLSRPNILFCIADDASYPHMGAYGCDWVRTPAFDRVAREGILFTHAYTPNAKCAPSRACILTGRNSWQLEAAANHWCYFPSKFKTFAETLSENGYFVGYTAKGWAPGVADSLDGKKRLLTGKPYNNIYTTPPTKYICKNDYAANFKDFLDQKPADKPFCFWYGSREPHRRYAYGSGARMGKKQRSDVDKVYAIWPDNDTVRTDLLDYGFEVEYFDSHLQKMLKLLEKYGLLENTLIVVTSDNGMPFPGIKGQEYEYSNHMPLAIMWKSGIANPGRRIDDMVSFIDFAPTFLEVAGIPAEQSGMMPITGHSLMDIFRSADSGLINPSRDHVLIGKERHDVGRPHDEGYPIRGIVKNGFLYLRNFKPERWPAGNPETGYLNCDGSPVKTFILNERRQRGDSTHWKLSFGLRPPEELYFIEQDPECVDNLASEAGYREIKRKLKTQLFKELKEQRDPRLMGNGDIFDQYPYADKKTANFYERYMAGEPVKAGWVNISDFERIPEKTRSPH